MAAEEEAEEAAGEAAGVVTVDSTHTYAHSGEIVQGGRSRSLLLLWYLSSRGSSCSPLVCIL
jgi:hypothetical protein